MTRAFIISAMLVSLPVWSAPKPKPEIKNAIEQLQVQVDKINNFSAKFKQTFRHKILKKDDSSAGTVKFKKPGFMRWDYSTPSSKSFIVDGKALWIHQPSDKLAMVDKCFKQDSLTASLSFLWGGAKIAKQFDAQYVPESNSDDLEIILTPKEKSKFYKRLILFVDSKTFQVKQSIVVDLEGNTNRFEFSDIELSKELSSEEFVFTPPKGTVVSKIPGSVDKCK